MIEIELEDFEDFYKKRINEKYFKIKKPCKKLISDIRMSLLEIKVCMDHFIESGTDKVDEKALRSLNFFSDKIKKEIDDIEVPEDEEIYYDNIMELLNSIKKLFTNMNEIQRKALPRFAKKVQTELKELAYLQRKLAKKQSMLDLFLRKKYVNPRNNVRKAEDLLKKLPKFFTLKENVENSKSDLDEFEKEFEERKERLEELNKNLLELEKNELFKDLEANNELLDKLKIEINEQLGFKRPLKKLKFELEKETIHLSNINLNYLKDFLKNPLKMLLSERKDLPNFSSLLVQLRHSLEEKKLNLKTETRNKTIQQINSIFEEKKLQRIIEKYMIKKDEIGKLENHIREAGLAEKLENVKNQVSSNTAKLEHVENDLNRKNKDFMRHLGNLKRERENFQELVMEVLEESIKLNITFNF